VRAYATVLCQHQCLKTSLGRVQEAMPDVTWLVTCHWCSTGHLECPCDTGEYPGNFHLINYCTWMALRLLMSDWWQQKYRNVQ